MQTRFQYRLMPIVVNNILESKKKESVPKKQNILLYEPIAMRTRNKVRSNNAYPVIDFDEASRAWNLNKRRLGHGCYEYITAVGVVEN